LEIHSAGHTSIDITKKGIDKAYGIRQMEKYLKIKIQDMLFVGDAIFPGGNDYAALKSGVDYVKVNSPDDTKNLINAILK
jgi:hydroxymethylpyrimidine pyrophosphatase-like HAD family hydrolase